MKPTHTHTHTQKMSSCRQNILIFDENGDIIVLLRAVQRNDGSVAGITVWLYIK
jgi:hypothetical protein